MNKFVVLSLLTALMLLVGRFPAAAQAQGPAQDLKPTFISPTPGLYVNGWPPFTVSYPKEWVEMPAFATAVFHAGAPRPNLPPGSPSFMIGFFFSPLPLEDWARMMMPVYLQLGTDVKVLYDKPSQLKDGTPAREWEVELVLRRGPYTPEDIKINDFVLVAKKDAIWFVIHMSDVKGRIGEDLKGIAYSLTFLQGREEPVKVPPDVRAFLDMYCTDIGSHEVTAIMAHFSDRYLLNGGIKKGLEQFLRNDPTSPIQQGVMSCEPTVTVFEPRGDKAYVDGFFLDKAKGDANGRKVPMYGQQIINEHGEWKWFGNQK